MAVRKRTQPIVGIGALLVAIVVGTLVMFGAKEPETAHSVSSDGFVTVSGEAAPSLGALSVTRRDDAEALDVGPAYEISLGGLPVPSGFQILMGYEADALAGVAPNRLSVFAYDVSAQKWIAISSVVDPGARTVVAESNGVEAILWTLGAR